MQIPDIYLPQLLAEINNNLPSTQPDQDAFRSKIINLARMVDKGSPYSVWLDHSRYQPQAATHYTESSNAASSAYMIQAPSGAYAGQWQLQHDAQQQWPTPWTDSHMGNSVSPAAYHGSEPTCEWCQEKEV